jgi:hypothetical protein
MANGAGVDIKVDVLPGRHRPFHLLAGDFDCRRPPDQARLRFRQQFGATKIIGVQRDQIAIAPRPRRVAITIDEQPAAVGDGAALATLGTRSGDAGRSDTMPTHHGYPAVPAQAPVRCHAGLPYKPLCPHRI